MTFSILARCSRTGRFGVALATSSPAVGARCPFAAAGIGAVVTQNRTDPRLGPAVLAKLQAGADAQTALDRTLETAPAAHWRQLAAIDAQGRVASFHGARTLPLGGEARGKDVIAVGNLLASPAVPEAMLRAFQQGSGDETGFEQRLLDALVAGCAAGGETRPLGSAALLVVDRDPFPVTDLRVDHHADPVGQLAKLWDLWAPQADAYRRRVHDPDSC
jgi:uncharacterized Ntn-hydrolase superfamily protein